jgi:hypothetical protein
MCGSEASGPLRLGNEYATVELSLDHSAKGPRLRVSSVRDGMHTLLDPVALALLCHADHTVFSLLADEARDHGALAELRSHRADPAADLAATPERGAPA